VKGGTYVIWYHVRGVVGVVGGVRGVVITPRTPPITVGMIGVVQKMNRVQCGIVEETQMECAKWA
jgi:hypothetical protein